MIIENQKLWSNGQKKGELDSSKCIDRISVGDICSDFVERLTLALLQMPEHRDLNRSFVVLMILMWKYLKPIVKVQ